MAGKKRFKCPHCGNCVDYIERTETYKELPNRSANYIGVFAWKWPCCNHTVLLVDTRKAGDMMVQGKAWNEFIQPTIEECSANNGPG